MTGVFARIDDRLLHSEVIHACIPALKVEHLIVSTRGPWLDLVDPTWVPRPIEVSEVDPALVATRIQPERITLVLMATLADLEVALDKGFKPSEVILANRGCRPGSADLTPAFWVDPGERAILMRCLHEGLKVVVQCHPAGESRAVDAFALRDLPVRDGE